MEIAQNNRENFLKQKASQDGLNKLEQVRARKSSAEKLFETELNQKLMNAE